MDLEGIRYIFTRFAFFYGIYGFIRMYFFNPHIPFHCAGIVLALSDYFIMMGSGAIDPELAMAKLEAINYIIGLMEENWSVLQSTPSTVYHIELIIVDMIHMDQSFDPEYLEGSKALASTAIMRAVDRSINISELDWIL